MKKTLKSAIKTLVLKPVKSGLGAMGYNLELRRKGAKPAAFKPSKSDETDDKRLSLIVAAYNVGPYIEKFLMSVFSQSSRLRSFEVIVVDDGSSDNTADIVKDWQGRYPNHIRYVHQENAGAAAARNTGLGLARGKWVCFTDPDDFLSVDYFRDMLKETEFDHEKPLLAVISNLVFYFEDTDEYSDSHPLKYKFKSGIVRASSDDLGPFIHLSGASIWIDRAAIQAHDLKFDSRVKPTFEDAHLINRIFLSNPGRAISFVPSATYYYRKRSDQSSQVDRAKTQRSWFIDKLEYGFLDLLETAERELGHVPRYIQRTCLYDTFWAFRYLVNHSSRADFLTPDDVAKFHELLDKIFAHIDIDVINTFELAGCTEEHKVALLALYKSKRRDSTAIYVREVDSAAGLVQFSYYSGGEDDFAPTILVNGEPVEAQLPSTRATDFMGRTYFKQRFFWVPLGDGDTIAFVLDKVYCRIRYFGKAIGRETDWLTLRNVVQKAAPNAGALDEKTKKLRAKIIASKSKYRGCWVLMDQDGRADDNAEHLYRYLMTTERADSCYFVLSKKSRDWKRLKDEGFNLLAYGSDEHFAAQYNAEALLSSHADQHILWPAGKNGLDDLVHSEFVFLQHGVTTNDVSAWLNFKPIRLFITCMPREAASLADPNGPYTFTAREALYSGFPRHDALLAKKERAKDDLILIVPTWRKYLTVENDSVGERRVKHEAFAESEFGRNWTEVLASEKLRKIAEDAGLKIMLVPHPNMAMYIEDMDIPDWIETVDVRKGVAYQDFLSRARIAITDFSSAVSDVAFLQRPVLYFQFDADEMFKGDHVYKKGFFEFERDGFGPVVTTATQVVDHIGEVIAGREDPVFAQRRAESFPFQDGKSCERVADAVARLKTPAPRLSPLFAATGSQDGTLGYDLDETSN